MAEVASLTHTTGGRDGGGVDGSSNHLVNELRRVTNQPLLNERTARFFLEMTENNVELAAVFYYEQQQQQQASSSRRVVAASHLFLLVEASSHESQDDKKLDMSGN